MSVFSHARIAVVEDDTVLREDLTEFLAQRGCSAQGFASAEDFYRGMAQASFDLALLDILLPGESGLDIARWLQGTQPGMGIVMLTSLGTASDQVKGLDTGADAYLAKNAPLDVIEATCRSVLRRLAVSGEAPMAPPAPRWRLNPYTHQLVAPQGETIELTHAQAVLLQALIESPGKPVSRQALLERLDKPDSLSNLRNLDSNVRRIRQKVLGACGTELPVKPSYGSGYLFADASAMVVRREATKGRA